MTEKWRYTNKYYARIVGWPSDIPLVRLGQVKGAETRLDKLISLIRHNELRVEIVTPREFAAFRAEGIQKGWRPVTRKTRSDIHCKRPETRRRFRQDVMVKPKSAEFVESSEDEIEEFTDEEVQSQPEARDEVEEW